MSPLNRKFLYQASFFIFLYTGGLILQKNGLERHEGKDGWGGWLILSMTVLPVLLLWLSRRRDVYLPFKCFLAYMLSAFFVFPIFSILSTNAHSYFRGQFLSVTFIVLPLIELSRGLVEFILSIPVYHLTKLLTIKFLQNRNASNGS